MPDSLNDWAQAIRADPALPIASRKVAKVLLEHFRRGNGRALLIEREIVDEAGLLDPSGVRRLLGHGWLARVAREGGRALYLPTTPVRLTETA
jgi:hypothetical protein